MRVEGAFGRQPISPLGQSAEARGCGETVRLEGGGCNERKVKCEGGGGSPLHDSSSLLHSPPPPTPQVEAQAGQVAAQEQLNIELHAELSAARLQVSRD